MATNKLALICIFLLGFLSPNICIGQTTIPTADYDALKQKEKDAEAAKDTISKLRKEIAVCRKDQEELKSLKEENNNLKAKAQSIEEEKNKVFTAKGQLQNNFATLESEKKKLLDSINTYFRPRLKSQESFMLNYEKMRIDSAERAKTIAAMGSDLGKLSAKNTALEQEKAQIASEKSNFEGKYNEANGKFNEVNTDREDCKSRLKTAEQKFAELESKYNVLRKEIGNYRKAEMQDIQKVSEALLTGRGTDCQESEIQQQLDRIAAMKATYDPPELQQLKVRLEAHLQTCRTIAKARQVLSKDFDPVSVQESIRELEPIKSGINEQMRQEVERLKKLLRGYCARYTQAYEDIKFINGVGNTGGLKREQIRDYKQKHADYPYILNELTKMNDNLNYNPLKSNAVRKVSCN